MNQSLEEEILEEEFLSTISSMLKGKNPDLNVITMEFYIGFYDLLKKYLLNVAREYQRPRKMLGALNSTFIALILKN
jgi:hypothetical protein